MFEPSSQELRITKMGVPLRVCSTLRLRDHFYSQYQIFRRRAARVAHDFAILGSEGRFSLRDDTRGVATRTEETVRCAVGVERRRAGQGRTCTGDTFLSVTNLHDMALHSTPNHVTAHAACEGVPFHGMVVHFFTRTVVWKQLQW